MNTLTIAITAVAGAAAGPWLRASIFAHHVPHGRPRRTRCPTCRHPIGRGWQRRLPVTGRCPACTRRLGAPLLAVETTTAAVLAVIAWRSPSLLLLAALGGLAVVGVVLSFIDLGVHRLPDPIVLATAAAIATALAVAAAASPGQWQRLYSAVLSALICGGFYLLIALFFTDGVGLGDVKWAAVLALVTGWHGVRTALAGLAAGAVIAVLITSILLALRLVHRKQALPFGPFLSAGALTALALRDL